jgi:protein-L-isoaspartate O-methyltransferase
MEIIEQQANHFPSFTPKPLARRMCDLAKIKHGQLVLEPSAGQGVLANEAQSRGAVVKCVELNGHLATELYDQGYHTLRTDFGSLNPDAFGTLFDAVVMCPPTVVCEAHIEHALKFLKQGGRLVASVKDEWNRIGEWFPGVMEVHTLPQNFFMLDGRPLPGAVIVLREGDKRIQATSLEFKA